MKCIISITHADSFSYRVAYLQFHQSFIKELVGHSHGSTTMDVYSGRKPSEVLLNKCVVKI